MARPPAVLQQRQRLIGVEEKFESTASQTRGNGAEEWSELIRERVRRSDPEQFPPVCERDRMRGQGGREVRTQGGVNWGKGNESRQQKR